MSLLTPQNDTPSISERQLQVARSIRSTAISNYNSLCQIQQQGINEVWHNNFGLTPQQVCDALGNEAGAAFILHSKLTNAIIEIAIAGGVTPDVLPPTNNFTVNTDGTVTILNTPYGT